MGEGSIDRMRHKLANLKLLAGLALIPAMILIAALASGCNGHSAGSGQPIADSSVSQRNSNYQVAVAKYPPPTQQNFPLRQALIKYTQRQDLLNHPWYIYVANDCYLCKDGIAYQYYVGQTYPLSTCDFLGSTEDVQKYEHGDTGLAVTTLTAPSLDGIYYGGSGATGGCDYFFFDAGTDALQVIQHDWKWFVSDHPLLLDAKLIQAQP